MKNVDRGFREGGDLTNKKTAVVSGGGGDCQLSAAVAASALEHSRLLTRVRAPGSRHFEERLGELWRGIAHIHPTSDKFFFRVVVTDVGATAQWDLSVRCPACRVHWMDGCLT